MFNSVTLVGRLAGDGELGRASGDGRTPILRFTLAVDRAYELDGNTATDFWPVAIVGPHGVRLVPHMTRGRLVLVQGGAHINTCKDAGGARRVCAFVDCRALRFLDGNRRWAAPS